MQDITPLVECTNLKYLDIKGNNIRNITPLLPIFLEQFELTWLEDHFSFRGNPVQNPPMDILTQGIAAIRNFTKQMNVQGSEVVYEAKILLVGEPIAGKTTLLEKLFNPQYEAPQVDQKATLGITVRKGRPFKYQDNPDIDIQGHIWDFGGQDIQYLLHQYFLTPDSLYVLVTDESKGINRYDYWFQIIGLLASKATVIVVRNMFTTDSRTQFNLSQYQKDFPELEITECEVDFKINDDRWEHLIGTICRKLQLLPVIGQRVPRLWKSIRKRIEQEKEKKYISIDLIEKWCKDAGLKEEEDILLLLRYYHKIGIVLYFETDPHLSNVIFLDPNWIVKGLYYILSGDYIQKNFGRFTKDWLFTRWKEKDYSITDCNLLRNLMLKDKFDLCYELPLEPNHFLLPLLLPESRPDYTWVDQDNLHFRYQYPFMPYGIISRLLVRLSHLIENNYFWATGAIFTSQGIRAEVIQTSTRDEGLKVIHIKLQGTNQHFKLQLLSIIRYEIAYIHKSAFPNLFVSEMVACICAECKGNGEFFDYKHLENFIGKNKPTIECRKSGNNLSIAELIGATYPDKTIKEEQGRLAIVPQMDLFVSYSEQDEEEVQAIVNELEQAGLKVWFAPYQIKHGDFIIKSINEGLVRSSHFLYMLSSHSLTSPWVNAKLDAAFMKKMEKNKKQIIPFLLEDIEIPALSSSFKAIAYYKDKDAGIKMLIDSIKK